MEDSERFWNEPILAPTDVKRQHYAPVLFLKSFANPSGKIRVFDLDDGTEFRTAPTNAAVQKNFNDLEIRGTILSTEEWLGQLENAAAPILRALIESPDNITQLSDQEEMHLARFITALRFRTPEFRINMSGMIDPIVERSTAMLQKQVIAKHGEEAASAWDEIKQKYDEQLYGEPGGSQPADLSTFSLGDVQGLANILWGAPWRIGHVSANLKLYTSDNPVAAFQHPVREWWETAAFGSLIYYVPLSPSVLLKVERRLDGFDESDPGGSRRRRDFTSEETSVTRHVVSRETTKYTFGDGLIVPRECANNCLQAIEDAKIRFAARFLGFNPNPPSFNYEG